MASRPSIATEPSDRGAGDGHALVFVDAPPPRRRPEPSGAAYVAPDSHRSHGSRAKYVVERCRCRACRVANREDDRIRRQAARADEAWVPYVPAGPARRHLARLAAAGIGLKTVARLSGVSHGTLSKLVYGQPGRGRPPSRRVRRRTSEAVLAVRVGDARGAQKVPAGPTWALLEDLVARGHTRTALARALGSTAATPALQLSRHRVRASTARRVEELHRRLVAPLPPSSTGRRR